MSFEDFPHKKTEDIMWRDLTGEEYEEAVGEDNKWFAAQALGHTPSEEEALNYYIEHSSKLHERLGLGEHEESAPETLKLPNEGSGKRAA